MLHMMTKQIPTTIRLYNPTTAELEFDGTDSRGRRLSSGSYVAVLETGEFRAARRLTLVQ